MTLTLIDPSTAAVVNHPSGLISVRCADYVGPARAGLSTTSDSLAAAGTAVTEEQTIAVQTSFAATTAQSRWALVDDTIVIPLGDLNREANVDYLPWVSVRTEGDLPVDGKYGAGWLASLALTGEGIGLAWGIGTTYYQSVTRVPNYRVQNYVLLDFFNQTMDDSETDAEDFVIRAHGVAGGDLVFFIETVYFVPVVEDTFTLRVGSQIFPGDQVTALGSNGQVFGETVDDDATGLPFFGGGAHSVLPWRQEVWAPGDDNWGQIVDFQTSEEQPSSKNLAGSGSLFSYPGKPSWLIIPVGATDIPPETFIEDDFSVDQWDRASETVLDIGQTWLRFVAQGTASFVQEFWGFGPDRRGSFVEAGSGKCTTYFGDTTGAGAAATHTVPGGGLGWLGGVAYGGSTLEGGFSSSEANTPDNYSPILAPYLESFEASVRASVLDFVADVVTLIGIEQGTLNGAACGAALRFTSAGDVTLELAKRESLVWETFDGPVTVGSGLATAEWWWVKVEKRGYTWRARAWEDGTTEPTTWDVEGVEPWRKLTTGAGWIDYPWESNWLGDVANDTEGVDPRGGLDNSQSSNGYLVVNQYALDDQARCRLEIDDYSAYYKPGDDSPGDIFLRVAGYDGSFDHGVVTIPFGAHRFVESSLRVHHFNDDEDGIDITVWKDTGLRDLMTAGVGRVFRWVKLDQQPFKPHIYRRPVSG